MIIDDETYQNRYEYCKEFIDKLCIWRSKNGEKLPGKMVGHEYVWMFYLRRGLFYKDFLECIAEMFIYKVEREIGHFNFQLAGMETASTPMLTAIPLICRAHGIEIEAFSIRKERKEYGLRNWIEGVPNKHLPVMLVDDLCNSQNSLLKAYEIVEQNKLELLGSSFTIVNKANKEDEYKMDGDKYFKNADIPMNFISLYTLDDFNLYIAPGDDLDMFNN